MILPDAIDHDTGGQGMLGGNQPASQLKPAAAFANGRLLVAGHDARKTPRNRLPQPGITASNVNADVVNTGLRTVRHPAFLSAVGQRQRGWRTFFQILQLDPETAQRRFLSCSDNGTRRFRQQPPAQLLIGRRLQALFQPRDPRAIASLTFYVLG